MGEQRELLGVWKGSVGGRLFGQVPAITAWDETINWPLTTARWLGQRHLDLVFPGVDAVQAHQDGISRGQLHGGRGAS